MQFSVALNGLPPVPVDAINFGPVRESIVGMDVIGQHVSIVGPGSMVRVTSEEPEPETIVGAFSETSEETGRTASEEGKRAGSDEDGLAGPEEQSGASSLCCAIM